MGLLDRLPVSYGKGALVSVAGGWNTEARAKLVVALGQNDNPWSFACFGAVMAALRRS